MSLKTLPFLLSALIIAGCAKEKEYDTVYKNVDLQKRSEIKTHHTVMGLNGGSEKQPIRYLYVPMSLGTPRKVREARPFFQGDEKIVRLDWSEKGLEVLEIEKDSRFRDNVLNDSPVMTIPVDYASYRCKEDQFGDCTNVEEENSEIEWHDKDYFVPKFEDIEVTEVNSLDIFNVGNDGCTSLQSTKLKDYEISDGVINIELEKTYKLSNSFSCIIGNYFNDDLSSSSFKVRYFYSLVELDKLASPGYKALEYPIADHDEFGFFKVQQSSLSPDYDRYRTIEKYFVERWNPVRKNNELVYYLSKNFNKPENKIILDATMKAVDIMNKGFKKIDNPFKLVVKQQKNSDKEISPGDLRYNTLVLIEDPLSNGLLGYGPAVSNPLTGEILQAHVNMYGGVLKSISRRAYDEAVDLSEAEVAAQAASIVQEDILVAPSALNAIPSSLATSMATAESTTESDTTASKINSNSQTFKVETLSLERTKQLIENKMKINTQEHQAAIAPLLIGDFGDMSEFDIKAFEFEKENFGLAEMHKHEPEFFPIGGTTKIVFPELKIIPGILKADGSLKRWPDLSQEQRDAAVAVVMEKAWIGTLIHEFGHNLGLRHNFAGSFDRANFMSDSDLAGLGMKPKERPAYSSIMDYAISEYNQLASFGNYDLAALRYSYKEEVEVLTPAARKHQDECLAQIRVNPNLELVCKPSVKIEKLTDSISSFDSSLEKEEEGRGEYKNEERKSYTFCTDSNAGLSSTCNRHDEGTSLTEVAKFRGERYERLYKYRNFRDGRLDFTAYNVPSYVFYRRYELSQIRDILEEYELFAGIFSPALMANGCGADDLAKHSICGMINDRIKAVEVIGDTLVNILKTPDHICALVKAENPRTIVEYRKLAEIYDDIKYGINYVPTTCFDDAVKAKIAEDELRVIGENGKFLNGFKDTNPNYRYSSDRAVLGTWPDKVMAMRALFNRRWKNRSTDDKHMALVDIPSIRAKVLGVIGHYLVGDPLPNPIPFRMENGNTFQTPYVIGNDYKVEQLEDYFGWIKRRLGMHAGGKSSLIDLMLKQTARGTNYGEEFKELAYEASNMASVRVAQHIPTALRSENFVYVDIKDLTYYASSENMIAKFMIDAINGQRILDSASKVSIAKVLKHRTNPDAPASLNDEDGVFFELNQANHDQLLNLATAGREFPLAVFVNAFGAERGPKIHAVYGLGLAHMKRIVEMKAAYINTPLSTMTRKEKVLFKLPVELLDSYLAGAITDESMEYYKKQIEKMPGHVSR